MATFNDVKIQLRKDTEDNWNTINPTLLNGEIAVVVTSTGIRFKMGDGASTYSALSFQDEYILGLITGLDSEVDTLSGTVTSLSSTVSGHTASIGTLQTDLDTAEGNISSLQSSLAGKANISSPVFSGVPKAPTASAGTNNTQIATTAFVQTALASIGGGGTTIVVSASDPGSTISVGDLWYKVI